MKIEKKLVALSILALVLGIITVVPIALMPSVAEPPPVTEPQIMTPEEFYAHYGTDTTDVIAYVAVPATDPDAPDCVDGTYWVAIMPVEEFYERYGTNTTIPHLTFYVFESEPFRMLESELGE